MPDRITYADASGSSITLVEGSPAEAVYRRSAAWTETERESIEEPEATEPEAPVEEPDADDPATEPEATEPEPDDLAAAYAAAPNVGAVKDLATSPEAARALLDMERASESPRSTLVGWLADHAGPEPEATEPAASEPAPEGEPSY